MLVPYPPGGATAIARIIQDSMERSLGQPIVVENVGGVGGMMAATRAEPDRTSHPARRTTSRSSYVAMREPGQTIKIGHAGVGSFSHLVGVLVAQQIGVKVT